MLQPNDKNECPIFFREHQPGETLIFDEAKNITTRDKKDY
jgi:hypothetical protein